MIKNDFGTVVVAAAACLVESVMVLVLVHFRANEVEEITLVHFSTDTTLRYCIELQRVFLFFLRIAETCCCKDHELG